MSKRVGKEESAAANARYFDWRKKSASGALDRTTLRDGNDVFLRMRKIEEFLQNIDALLPQLVELRTAGLAKLSRKEVITLEHIFSLLDQSQAYRAEYFRIAQKLKSIQSSVAEDRKTPLDANCDEIDRDRNQAPEKRLARIRKAVELKYVQAIPSATSHRIRHWEDEIKETCARLLSEDIEGAAAVLNKQRSAWNSSVSKAEFGFPGFSSRLRAFRSYWKAKNLKRDFEADQFKLEALHKSFLKHKDGVAFLAGAAMSYFKIFDSSGSSAVKRFEKMMRLECENEISIGIQKRGQSLTESIRQEKFLSEQKSTYCSQALDFVRGRAAYHSDLRTHYEQAKVYSANAAIERVFHSTFAICAESLSSSILQLKQRCQFLAHELHFQRAELLNRLSKASRAIDMDAESMQEKESYDQGFVIPPKEVVTRN